MCWIKSQIKKLDENITDDMENIILSIMYDDLVRNGKCSVNEFITVICGNENCENGIPLQKKANKILEITYKMVSGM